ncbi:hypothetical protein D3C85_1271430 [compost metagenome]
MLPARENPRDLSHRRNDPSGQDRAGDQITHGHIARTDLINPDDHHGDIAQLLHHCRAVTQPRRDGAHLDATLREFGGQALPQALIAPFRTGGLDGFQIFDGLQQ